MLEINYCRDDCLFPFPAFALNIIVFFHQQQDDCGDVALQEIVFILYKDLITGKQTSRSHLFTRCSEKKEMLPYAF